MNFYREWKRWYVDFSFSAGRYPRLSPDELALRAALAESWVNGGDPITVYESDFGIAKVSAFTGKPDPYAAMQDAWAQSQAAHPFQDPDALTGNITTPAGAQDFTVVPQEGGGGWGVVDVTRAAYVPNPVNQNTGD